MRPFALAAVGLGLATVPLTANAAVVAGFVSAVVYGFNTTDTYGIFGPAGASLAGKRMNIYFQYSTGDFGAPRNCDTNVGGIPNPPSPPPYACSSYATTGSTILANPAVPGSSLFVVDVDGAIASYAPVSQGIVTFDNYGGANDSPGNVLYITDPVTASQTTPYSQLFLSFQKPVTFGEPLAPPYNNVVTTYPTGLQSSVTLYSPAHGSEETLSFTVLGTGN